MLTPEELAQLETLLGQVVTEQLRADPALRYLHHQMGPIELRLNQMRAELDGLTRELERWRVPRLSRSTLRNSCRDLPADRYCSHLPRRDSGVPCLPRRPS
jgi:hypothetical protein